MPPSGLRPTGLGCTWLLVFPSGIKGFKKCMVIIYEPIYQPSFYPSFLNPIQLAQVFRRILCLFKLAGLWPVLGVLNQAKTGKLKGIKWSRQHAVKIFRLYAGTLAPVVSQFYLFLVFLIAHQQFSHFSENPDSLNVHNLISILAGLPTCCQPSLKFLIGKIDPVTNLP